MNKPDVLKLLAQCVHRGLVTAADAKAALATDDPVGTLIRRGVVDRATWSEWIETEAGSRPKLSRYELGDRLGEGGQATVFRAIDRTPERNDGGARLALKVLKPALAKNPASVNGFIAEARTLIELDHEHIVKGRRIAREGDVFFFAMDLVEGENLQERLDREVRLDEELALRVVQQVALALAYLHGRGLVHRDVKPGNIMLTEGDHAVLIDLGFAVDSAGGGGETTAGTVHYISPEQARAESELDVRADIYSLGATLYHLVTGSLPFSGESNQDVLAKQVLESLSGERIRDMGLAQHTHYFIEKMMAKEKEIRFQDPEQLAKEIGAWLAQREHQRELERGPEWPGRPRRERSSGRRRRRR